jgi:hypothetical protein
MIVLHEDLRKVGTTGVEPVGNDTVVTAEVAVARWNLRVHDVHKRSDKHWYVTVSYRRWGLESLPTIKVLKKDPAGRLYITLKHSRVTYSVCLYIPGD